jgi:hypothetical protein
VNPVLARLIARLYPRVWRERYGQEFEAMLEMGRGDLRTLADSVWSAICERISPTGGVKMNQNSYTLRTMLKQPSAVIPVAMSLAALAIVIGHIAVYGAAREADEGAVAHLWQLLMAAQLPIIAYFAIRWLPRAPKQTVLVLAQQAGAALASIAVVFYFNL